MKIATYNIASGGFASYDSGSKRPERLEELKKAIRSIDADIIGLTDTFRWRDTFSPEQIQQAFGYPYSFHIDMDDTRVDNRIGVAILSRCPILSSKPIRLHNRSAIQATIKTDSGAFYEFFVVYLDDLSETTRQKQAQALASSLPGHKATIVMGDFNALWPQHVMWVKSQVMDFLVAHPEFEKRSDYEVIHKTFSNFYKTTALPGLKECGLTEATGLRPTALTPLHTLRMPAIFPVDHILAKNCVISDYSVLSGKMFDIASDHYPLVAILR